MTIRSKTITFATATNGSIIPNNTPTMLDPIQLDIPDYVSVVSVLVEVGFMDVVSSAAATILEHQVGMQLGTAGSSIIIELDDITNSGEHLGGVTGPWDFTNYFRTNFTGPVMTLTPIVHFSQTATAADIGMACVSYTLHITYLYDDQSPIQVKTVRIPFDCNTSSLSSGWAGEFIPMVPLLGPDGMLCEKDAEIVDLTIVGEGNTSGSYYPTSSTEGPMMATLSPSGFNITGADIKTVGFLRYTLLSDVYCRLHLKPTNVDYTKPSHLMWQLDNLGKFHNFMGTAVVTYKFKLAGTTRVLNSLILPYEMSSPGQNTGPTVKAVRNLNIQEPGEITLKQSAVRHHFNTNGEPGNTRIYMGDQTGVPMITHIVVACGMYSMQRRFDAEAKQGLGITLQRGDNELAAYFSMSSSSVRGTNMSGYFVLNYHSDLSPQGIGAHAHTVFQTLLPWDARLTDYNKFVAPSLKPSVPEDVYYLQSVGFCFTQWIATSAATIILEAFTQPGEASGTFVEIYADAYISDAERAYTAVWMRGRDVFKRFPGDADPDRIDPMVSRTYKLYTTTTSSNGIMASLTYHAMTWTVAGSISGANLALPTELALVRDGTDEVRQRLTLPAGTTAFSFLVHDNTSDYYITARQGNINLGRSASGKAA